MENPDQSIILDLLVRVYCLEKILIEKNHITREDYIKEINQSSEKLMTEILKKMKYEGSVEDFLSELKKTTN